MITRTTDELHALGRRVLVAAVADKRRAARRGIRSGAGAGRSRRTRAIRRRHGSPIEDDIWKTIVEAGEMVGIIKQAQRVREKEAEYFDFLQSDRFNMEEMKRRLQASANK